MNYLPAYSKGKPIYSQANPRPGAYAIYYNGRVQYVGSSSYNVVKTACRHFQSWSDPMQYRATFPKRAKLLVIFTKSPRRAKQIEAELFRRFLPEKNTYLPPAIKTEPEEYPF